MSASNLQIAEDKGNSWLELGFLYNMSDCLYSISRREYTIKELFCGDSKFASLYADGSYSIFDNEISEKEIR